MTINAHIHGAGTSEAGLHRSERRPAADAGTGLGGNCVAHIVQEHCPDMLAAAGVGIAYHAKPVVRHQAHVALSYSGLDGVINLFAD